MALVPTVRGPIEPSALGTTFMHEHVFVLTPDVQQNFADEWDEEPAGRRRGRPADRAEGRSASTRSSTRP